MRRRALLALASVFVWNTALGQAASPDTTLAPTTSPPPTNPPTNPPTRGDVEHGRDHLPDKTLTRFRKPIQALTERSIGRSSRRVRFDWRRSAVMLGAMGALPAELNNYDTLKAGGFVRFPSDGVLIELGLSYAWVSGSVSTEKLALTPYRQPGRPDRVELDVSLAYPLAEGIVTAFPRFVPATELVLNAHAQFRYLIYPGGYADLDFTDTLKALVSGQLSEAELNNLEDDRLPAMEIDPARYGVLAGLGNDLYFASGFFYSHKFLVVVPLLNFLTETELGYGYELNVSVGFAL